MGRSIYKILVEDNEIAIFYELEDAMIFVKGLCQTYGEELKKGFNFTIIEVEDNEQSTRKIN